MGRERLAEEEAEEGEDEGAGEAIAGSAGAAAAAVVEADTETGASFTTRYIRNEASAAVHPDRQAVRAKSGRERGSASFENRK